MNDEVMELEPDDEDRFETNLSFESGGSYIMVDYDGFSGEMELNCEYANHEEDSQ